MNIALATKFLFGYCFFYIKTYIAPIIKFTIITLLFLCICCVANCQTVLNIDYLEIEGRLDLLDTFSIKQNGGKALPDGKYIIGSELELEIKDGKFLAPIIIRHSDKTYFDMTTDTDSVEVCEKEYRTCGDSPKPILYTIKEHRDLIIKYHL